MFKRLLCSASIALITMGAPAVASPASDADFITATLLHNDSFRAVVGDRV
ncbi:MAG: hypothetical protein KGH84_10460 [Paracoccaceae bacterium]|nr:hypothetical protein [Paracoccaceae bacterium]